MEPTTGCAGFTADDINMKCSLTAVAFDAIGNPDGQRLNANPGRDHRKVLLIFLHPVDDGAGMSVGYVSLSSAHRTLEQLATTGWG